MKQRNLQRYKVYIQQQQLLTELKWRSNRKKYKNIRLDGEAEEKKLLIN